MFPFLDQRIPSSWGTVQSTAWALATEITFADISRMVPHVPVFKWLVWQVDPAFLTFIPHSYQGETDEIGSAGAVV
jgi:hypothetical protein